MTESMNENQADSSASRIEETTEDFSNMTLKSEDQKPGETPQQKSDSSVTGSGEKARRKLNLDADQSHDGTKKPIALPEREDGEREDGEREDGEREDGEREDGEWLEKNPWKNETPSRQDPIKKTVDEAKVYPVPAEYLNSEGKVDLEKIYSNLPKFINEMKGPSIRQELEQALQIDVSRLNTNTKSTLLKAIDFEKVKPTPHVLEIAQKQNDVVPKDNASFRNQDENNRFKAFSLTAQENQHQPSENNYWFLDCEYMLKMHLPVDTLQWFNKNDQQGKRIREITPEKKDKRWVFIPSFRRARIALLEWPQDNIVTQKPTIRILVVRPSEFDDYVACCGHEFPVICLPQDEIGAGYPRYWIQKIALRLGLQFIWMIDDSVECFYEYHPDQNPPKPDPYLKYRRRKFELVFERIESLVKATKDENPPIAAMSPKRFRGGTKLKKPFVCKPPRIAVFLNLAALKSKEVYYRPELQVLEDMIFGYECDKNGLKVFIDNRIHLQDHPWEDTGARSPSVRQKPT